MIADGVPAKNILMFTFTKKAAEEIKARVCKEVGQLGMKITVGTYHSFCSRLLRRYAQSVGFKRNFSIYDDDDVNKEIKNILDKVGKKGMDIDLSQIRKTISGWKEHMMNPTAARASANNTIEKHIADIYEIYQNNMKCYNSMDFDDLIYFVIRLFESNKEALEEVNEKYHYIIADEVQDSSPRDLQLIYYLGGKRKNICVVGDDSQSIYSFRGANLPALFEFIKELEFKKYLLEQNYRSTKTIVNAANSVITENKTRINKTCFSENSSGNKILCFGLPDVVEEAQKITNIIKAVMKNSDKWGFEEELRYKDIAVLYRTNRTSRPIEEAFINSNIPYEMLSGVPFYAREEIKDIMAYIRILVNPHDYAALSRVVDIPKRGIGKITLEKINSCFIDGFDDIISLEKLKETILTNGNFKGVRKSGLENFFSVLETLNEMKDHRPPKDIIDELMNLIDYRHYREVKDGHSLEKVEERFENIEELKTLSMSAASLEDFAENIIMSQEIVKDSEEENAVQMVSIHGAKGLEWPVVIIAGGHDSNLPHFAAMREGNLEEERRLFYVAMTRAKDQLFITYPKEVKTSSGPRHEEESRFIREIESCYLRRA